MAAVRYLGDRTKIAIGWGPRRAWDPAWVQGAYDVVVYDKARARSRGRKQVHLRELDVHVNVARGERWGWEGLHGTLTLGDLGLERPAMPMTVVSSGPSPVKLADFVPREGKERLEVIDYRDMVPCRVHEDCRESIVPAARAGVLDKALAWACGEQQKKMALAEDAAREKLLGTPAVIDTVAKILVQRIVSASREELGYRWFGAEGIRADFAKYGLAVRRAPVSGPAW